MPPSTALKEASSPLLVAFHAGETGPWKIDRLDSVSGESLAPATHLTIVEGVQPTSSFSAVWTLRGVISSLRYTTQPEVAALKPRSEGLGRPHATRAALIPIRKSPAWWALAQNERRAIFEEQSHHIAVGLEYLPQVARRLHHSRDLAEPFDFITWFEYPPEAAAAFEEMVRRMRASREWTFVDREVDIRLSR